MTDIAEQFNAGGWSFTPEVTEVFDQHVSASVPHYEHIQAMVAEVADWALPSGGLIADLGASTGTTVDLIARRHPDRHLRAYLYDEVPEMLAKAQEKLAQHDNLRVEKRIQRLQAPMDHPPTDLVTALFTLQFLDPAIRATVLRTARSRAKLGSVILVAEKVRPVNSLWHEIGIDASHDYKEHQGLSDTAIRQKAKSLRGVLIPQSMEGVMSDLTNAGWREPETLFRWHQWVLVGAQA
jgi:tRNA (cmo5U34)-methyltransferase